ncbi:hypothetical protein [Butyrivibrio fibrisolvens]|uniref:Uncharacterized protein n=1 Tax=Butyrivibrio fibrisolvens TaxID=831 RepID=A0A317G5V9_BUTFI|nr:hypothetical protein [Butyrivibrio fibrisolvens]PWT27860.1 hypothetical protein CPT75_12500 [Butyrivibrio fibrisolvens]
MIIFKSFSHISYTLEDDEYSKLALKMLSNSASINIIKPVSSKANGAKRFMYSVKELTSLSSMDSALEDGLICRILGCHKEVLQDIDAQTFLKK